MHFYYQWAVMIGGGLNHRMGLFDAIMIKDNHIASAGSVAKALESAQTYLSAALEFMRLVLYRRFVERFTIISCHLEWIVRLYVLYTTSDPCFPGGRSHENMARGPSTKPQESYA